MRVTPAPTIAELTIPDRVGTARSAAFEEMVAVMNGVALDLWGNDDFVYSAEAELASFQTQNFHEKVVFVAILDGAIVGRVVADFPLEEDAVTASLLVDVVPALGGRGIGSALLATGEDLVAAGGRTVISAYTEHPVAAARVRPGSETVRAELGPSGLPADSPDVRFALSHGYRLGQIERSSSLALPMPVERTHSLRADALARSDGYGTLTWWRTTPDELLDEFAALKERMSTDVPHSGIALDDEHWTADRVREYENESISRGEPYLVTAARHLPSGRLVAYTEIAVPDDGDKAEQTDTLVESGHRGHRLGTW